MNRSTIFLLLVYALFFNLIPDAIAGCRVNYDMVNKSQEGVTLSQFQVKSKGGKWRNVIGSKRIRRCFTTRKGHRRCMTVRRTGLGYFLSHGTEVSTYYKATFGCKAKRRYRFEIGNDNCKKYIYYPSATSWTKSINIHFGDISRYCR